MPALQHDNSCPSPDIPTTEILYRHSINSLLGLQGRAGPSEGDTLMSISSMLGLQPRQQPQQSPRVCIPAPRASQQGDDFPNSPVGGQTPRSLLPQYFPPRNVSCFGSYSEIGSGLDKVLMHQHRSTPDCDNMMPTPSSTPNIDNSITELMNCLSLMPPQSSHRYQSKYNSFKDVRERSDSSSTEDVKCRWYGVLPPRRHSPSGGFSPKVFLGGLPWDITESTLVQAFQPFGLIRVEWPRKEQSAVQPKGYVYVIFESERQVRCLLESSTCDASGNWFYRLSSKKMRSKEVQIIPWALDDSNYVKSSSVKLDPSRTVFVGALHGMLSAEGLAKIMNELFNGVVYAGIDTDKHKYPIGSGRVTFNNSCSYMRAVSAAFVEIKTEKFFKKVQVDPYIEDSMCSICNVQQGPYFCREPKCFRYFCRSCWYWQHAQEDYTHKPLMRHSRSCGSNGSSSFNGYSVQQGQSSPTASVSSNGCGSNNGSSNPRYKRTMNGGMNNCWNFKNVK